MDSADEKLRQASEAFASEKYQVALAILEPLVAAGNPAAIGQLGTAYQLGLGVEVNGIKALELLTQAAELGDGVAAHNLGTIHLAGMPGIEPNAEKAKQFYQLAKKLGAQFADDAWYG